MSLWRHKNLQTKWKSKQEKITTHKKDLLTFIIMTLYYKLYIVIKD